MLLTRITLFALIMTFNAPCLYAMDSDQEEVPPSPRAFLNEDFFGFERYLATEVLPNGKPQKRKYNQTEQDKRPRLEAATAEQTTAQAATTQTADTPENQFHIDFQQITSEWEQAQSAIRTHAQANSAIPHDVHTRQLYTNQWAQTKINYLALLQLLYQREIIRQTFQLQELQAHMHKVKTETLAEIVEIRSAPPANPIFE